MTLKPENVAFCFPVGGEKYIQESVYLARSINHFLPESEIFVGIKKGEKDKLDQDLLDELEDLATVVKFEVLRENYPEIKKTATMEAASKETVKDNIICLDTDLLVCGDVVEAISDSVEGLEKDWMVVKTANYGSGRHILGGDSEEWQELYNNFDVDFPGFMYESSYDKKKIPPYFAGGVVATDSKEFCKQWNKITAEVYDILGTRYSDQVALGILSRSYDIGIFEDRYFWDTPSVLKSPGEEVLIHYSKLRQLTIVSSERLENVKNAVGIDLREMYPGSKYFVSVFKAYLLYMYLKFNLPRFFEETKIDLFKWLRD